RTAGSRAGRSPRDRQRRSLRVRDGEHVQLATPSGGRRARRRSERTMCAPRDDRGSRGARTMNVEKYQGTGNDFFVIDASEPVADRRALAIELCDGDDGLAVGERTGADGVLFLALEDGYASPRVVMTLVQPDGSTAPMCGNGARCAAAWAAERT